jgi:hypothetical protein
LLLLNEKINDVREDTRSTRGVLPIRAEPNPC